MKIFIILTTSLLFLLTTRSVVFSQDVAADSLLQELATDVPEKAELHPEKMLFSQRLFWGEKGIYRLTGIAPKELTVENREKELKVRRTMFRLHQAIGIATAVGMAAQGYVGSRIYKPATYTDRLSELHEGLATAVNIGYGTTALLAFTSPPPMYNRKKFDNIKLHKYLSYIHLAGMITTNVLADGAGHNKITKNFHRVAAFTTFGAYAAAIISIKAEF